MRPRFAAFIALALLAGLLPLAGRSLAQTSPLEGGPVAQGRETEAVVLTGTNFPTWATLGDVALEGNSLEGAQCELGRTDEIPQGIRDQLDEIPDSPVTAEDPCTHNQYEDPDFQSSDFVPPANATPIDRLLGYRWTENGFEQIPFQVDEMMIQYLSNNNSGFAFYSETDQHTTYAFDREGFRWTGEDPNNPCLARPESEVAEDPVPGLDTDDELAFMARDAGARAPATAPMPAGIDDSYEVAVADPVNGTTSFVYVMKASENGPRPKFDASNGYVRYERDPDSNIFLFSESSFENYGATEHGPWYDPATGICHSDPSEWKQHRPGDQATVTTPRYRFRYEGRWLMTELNISSDPQGNWEYGPDVIDQWKARAFQQRPGGETPCCGYEEEVNNWGGSSILMGELSGPVRTIRETWGADSGTNVVRREVFYRDEIRFISFLRVHVIPPGDGIYAQWDYNAGIMTRYYNPLNPNGVPIDGKNDDRGNTRIYASHDGLEIDPDGENGPQEPIGQGKDRCPSHDLCINNDIDVPDPAFSGVNAGANWEQIAGPHGTLVSRYQLHKATPGSAHSVVTVPYYRDDACFDDGTGSNPGPHLDARDVDGDEESDANFTAADGTRQPRRCWDSATDPAPPPEGDPQYYQGSIGTHGIHILLIADSDNAHTTLPITEIDGDQRVVVLPGEKGNVGETYGRQPEKPLVVAAAPERRPQGPEPTASPSTSSPAPTKSATPSESPTPTQRGTSVDFTAENDAAGQYSDPATFQARLTDDGGNALAGEDITFELTGADGTSSWSATTNENGVASVDVTLDRKPGSYQLLARYAGDDQNLGDAESTSFTVDPEDSDLALQINGKNSKRTLSATLTDRDSGAGIADRTIEFFSDGDSLGTATTDANGVASHDAPAGKRSFEARFAGDDYYIASSAQQRS